MVIIGHQQEESFEKTTVLSADECRMIRRFSFSATPRSSSFQNLPLEERFLKKLSTIVSDLSYISYDHSQ